MASPNMLQNMGIAPVLRESQLPQKSEPTIAWGKNLTAFLGLGLSARMGLRNNAKVSRELKGGKPILNQINIGRIS
jgi:hypothetical protein